MTTEEHKILIPIPQDDSLIDVVADKGLLQVSASGSTFLPYLQLFTTRTDAVADGKIVGGEYGLVKDGDVLSLGKDINIIFLSVRSRAFQKEDSGTCHVAFVTSVPTGKKPEDVNPEYARIKELQNNKVKGCMVGPDFLIWVPSEETFATSFCGSVSLRREARKWGAFLGGKAANLRSKLTPESPNGRWHVPVTNSCSVELSPLPDPDDVVKQIEKFKNPPKPQQGEAVEETSDVAR